MRPQLLTDLITMVGIFASVQSCTVSCLHIICCLALAYAACSQHCLRLFKSMMSVKCTTILLPQLSSWTCATQCRISQILLANRLHVLLQARQHSCKNIHFCAEDLFRKEASKLLRATQGGEKSSCCGRCAHSGQFAARYQAVLPTSCLCMTHSCTCRPLDTCAAILQTGCKDACNLHGVSPE